MVNAWLVLAVGDDRAHGGNDGYDDAPSQHYSWDSTVHHHARMAPGDVIALWDTKVLLGISVIEKIDSTETSKDLYTCPVCRKSDFKARRTKLPKYRCNCGAEFDEAVSRRVDVTAYRSQHGAAWVPMYGVLPGSVLRGLCDAPNSQLSLRSLRWEKLRDAILSTGAATTIDIADQAQRAIAGGHKLTAVRVRIGQSAFRKKLLDKHGPVCAFTGPTPAAALEAAHLYSYAATGEHISDGGILLRRDLHRLFDLGLLAVHPDKATVDVAEQLEGFPLYATLHGEPLAIKLSAGHLTWLQEHWTTHRA